MSPLIIEGVPRSGTRFLCKFIETQFNIKIFRIQSFIRDYYKLIEDYKVTRSDFAIRRFLESLEDNFIFSSKVGSIQNFLKNYDDDIGFIINDFLDYKAKQEGFLSWGLKFDNPSGMHICDRLFPGCKYIHIIRDGRDVHLSAKKCLDEGFYTSYNNSRFWQDLVKQRKDYGSFVGKDRYLEIKYEILLKDSEQVAKDISYFIKYNNFKYVEMNINKANFGKWKNEMNGRSVKIYEAIAGQTLRNFGYETTHANEEISLSVKLISNILEKPLKLSRYLAHFFDYEKRKRLLRLVRIRFMRFFKKL